MSFTDTDVKQIFTGDGSTTTFALNFDFNENGQIEVWLRDESGASVIETKQTISTNYSLTGSPPTSVEMTTAPSATQKLIVKRNTTLVQNLNLSETTTPPMESIEDQFDRIVHTLQELSERADRCLVFPVTSPSSGKELPEPDDGKVLSWDSLGNPTNTPLTTTDATLASQAEAEAETENTKYMSALRVAQLLSANFQTYLDAAAKSGGVTSNIGMNIASNVLTIYGKDGSALSSSNPGLITMQSQANPGRVVDLKLTGNIAVRDRNATDSDLEGGELFGLTTGVAHGDYRPFYLYAINVDDTNANMRLAISMNPCYTEGGFSTNNVCFMQAACVTSDLNNIMILNRTGTKADYIDKPMQLIGGFRMNKDASDYWQIAPFDGLADGIRQNPHVGYVFDFSAGHLGADTDNFFASTVGNGPSWATPASIVAKYMLDLNGNCHYWMDTTGAGNCTNGGAGVLQLVMPYYVIAPGQSETELPTIPIRSDNPNYVHPRTNNSSTAVLDCYQLAGTHAANDFTNAARDIYFQYDFRAFQFDGRRGL